MITFYFYDYYYTIFMAFMAWCVREGEKNISLYKCFYAYGFMLVYYNVIMNSGKLIAPDALQCIMTESFSFDYDLAPTSIYINRILSFSVKTLI